MRNGKLRLIGESLNDLKPLAVLALITGGIAVLLPGILILVVYLILKGTL